MLEGLNIFIRQMLGGKVFFVIVHPTDSLKETSIKLMTY